MRSERGGVRASALMGVAGFAVLATAARPAAAYRPFDGTDAGVPEVGEFELEIGPALSMRATRPDALILPAVVLNLGIYRGVEAFVETKNVVPLEHLAGVPPDYASDSDAEVKIVLRRGCLQGSTGPSIALESGVLLPSPNGERGFGAAADLITSQQMHPFVFHLNLEGELDREQHGLFDAGLIAEYESPFAFRPVTEVEVGFTTTGVVVGSALVGGIFTLDDAFAIDFAFRGESVGGVVGGEARLGLTWTLPVWHPKQSAESARPARPAR